MGAMGDWQIEKKAKTRSAKKNAYLGGGGGGINLRGDLQKSRTKRFSGKDRMWGYKESDLDMSGMRKEMKKQYGWKSKKFDQDAFRKDYAASMAYKKGLKENKFGAQDWIDKRNKGGFIGGLGRSLKSVGKTLVNDMLPKAALIGGGLMGASALAGAGLFGGAGVAAGAGTGTGAAAGAGGGWLAGGGGQAALHGSLAGTGGAGGLAGAGTWAAGGGGAAALNGTLPGVAGAAGGGGGMFGGLTQGIGGIFGENSMLDVGLGGLGMWQTHQANQSAEDAIKQGYEMQNPWVAGGGQKFAQNELMAAYQDPSRFKDTPGYQFALDEANRNAAAQNSATGNRLSGRALLEASERGAGLASQMWNTEMDRLGMWSGAQQATTGGTAYGQDKSSLGYQSAYDTSYFLNNLFGGGNANRTSGSNWMGS